MNDLNTLLDRAAGPTGSPLDVHADLTRARRALSRTRRRRSAAGLVGVAAAGVLGVGVLRQPDGGDGPQQATERFADDTPTADVSVPPAPVVAGSYTFPSLPDGWEVQGFRPSTVTIAPVGTADEHPDSFTGKLVIMFDGNPPSGEKVEHDGRTFWVIADSGEGYMRLTTRTLPGEPEGNVLIQYPAATGWELEAMLDFLAGVHVDEGAEKGVG
jgi:hypothetical protein